ncbi:nucleotidyltransferase family protein [Xenorhabdus bovienii]|uniref:nucleotidyltransferase family protein n=1 Tax=Xenorhabdus bovienii TaxID=40576 RepID=UPI0023B2658A|nr:nucleotidyltransferase family protein [Xenorhabdus bovienii]MDE9541059.1 nucleotidyltransferase family protein [Xenorhabdus bovienii]
MNNTDRLHIFRSLIASYLDGTSFEPHVDIDISFLNRHKLIPILNYIVESQNIHNLLGHKDYELISTYCEYTERKLIIFENEMRKISKELEKLNITHVYRKGLSLSRLYKKKSHRIFNDIDILINKSESEVVTTLLASLGYCSGYYHHATRLIKPHRKETIIKYRMSPDHHLPLVKIVDGIPVVIDIAFNLEWASKSQLQDIKEVLNNKQVFDNFNFMNPEFNYIHTIYHLLRECFFQSALKTRPPYLSSFLDVYLMSKIDCDPHYLPQEDNHYFSKIESLTRGLLDSSVTYEQLNNSNKMLIRNNEFLNTNIGLLDFIFTERYKYNSLLGSLTFYH